MLLPNQSIPLAGMETYADFDQAAKAVLGFLRSRIEMPLWMVTRTREADDQWVVLQAIDGGMGAAGVVLKWSTSFCSKMVQGLGPRIAPDSMSIPAYAAQAVHFASIMPIASYIGVPMMNEDGSLFGTICGISPAKLPESVESELPLIELLSRMLGTVLAKEIRETAARRDAEQARTEANRDALTGLFNRRGLYELLEREEARCHRYGHDAGVISIDLNGLKQLNDTHGHAAGDDVLRRAATAIKRALRRTDFAARIGGDEFVAVAVETGSTSMGDVVMRLRDEFTIVNVSAAIGVAQRLGQIGMSEALKIADARMYDDKREMKSLRLHLSA